MRIGARPVREQGSELACGLACAQMLLEDRGVRASQEQIGASLALPAEAAALARAMNGVSPLRWQGGALNLADSPDQDLVEATCSVFTSWAALLEPGGPKHVGHWVVVDGVDVELLVMVRDPIGAAYGIPITEFLGLWRYAVVILEQELP
jgi:ABC-type bacteriocin/lantibiotic exporter with double-glycine peptidase domain